MAGLAEDARKRAMEGFPLLQPHLEQNEPLVAVAKAAGLAYRTAHRLVSQYRRDGLVALVRKKRTDRGQRRAVSDKLKAATEGLALQKPPLPVSALHRRVIKLAQEIGEPLPQRSGSCWLNNGYRQASRCHRSRGPKTR